jgi:AcrR family transcriptional regulator
VRQERSRTTLARLLDAAEEALEAKGLAAATVPEIAARAGMSVGVVYRRFPDKDALLRGVFERFFTTATAQNRAALEPARWSGRGVTEIIHAIVTSMVTSYRQRRGLLSALVLYVEMHDDVRFRQSANELMNAASADIVALLTMTPRSREIRHPDPALAIELVLVMLGSTLRRVILSAGLTHGREMSDSALAAELERAFLAYLGVRPRRRG